MCSSDLRERRARYEQQPGLVEEILREGSRKVRALAAETMERVRAAMGLTYFRS